MMVKYKEKFALASRPERHLAERVEASIPQPGQSLDYHDEHHVQRGECSAGPEIQSAHEFVSVCHR